jgi:hypothetical protein
MRCRPLLKRLTITCEQWRRFVLSNLTQNVVPSFRQRLNQYAIELRPRVVMQRWEKAVFVWLHHGAALVYEGVNTDLFIWE